MTARPQISVQPAHTLSSAEVDQIARVSVRAVERLTEYLMTEREPEQPIDPLSDPLIRAVDDLTTTVARLAHAAPPADHAAFDAALGTLLRVVFDRVTSMAASPTVVFGGRVDRLDALQARTAEDIVHRVMPQTQRNTDRIAALEKEIAALKDEIRMLRDAAA